MVGMQEGQQPNEPGQVISPGSLPDSLPELPPEPAAITPVAPFSAISEPPQPAAPDVDPSQPVTESTQEDSGAHIEWTASEYITNPKSAGWFGALAIGSVVLAIVVFIVTREWLSAIIIGILGIIVGIFAARQPQTLSYRIDSNGLQVGDKFYPYGSFKTFSVAREHAIGFIQLLPLKRFMPPLVIHYAPEDEDRIAEVLASYLPYEEHKADMVDSLTRKLRF